MKNINFENKRKGDKAYNKAFERRREEYVRQYCTNCEYRQEDGDCKTEKVIDCPMIKNTWGRLVNGN